MTDRQLQSQHEDAEHTHKNAPEPQNQVQSESAIDPLGIARGRFKAGLPPPPSDNAANRALMRTMRQNVVLRMQQTQGNRAVQRFLSRTRSTTSIQRQVPPGLGVETEPRQVPPGPGVEWNPNEGLEQLYFDSPPHSQDGREVNTPFGHYYIVPRGTQPPPGAQGEIISEETYRQLEDSRAMLHTPGMSNITILEPPAFPGSRQRILDQFDILLSRPAGRRLVLQLLHAHHRATIVPIASGAPDTFAPGRGAIPNPHGQRGQGSDSIIRIPGTLTGNLPPSSDSNLADVPNPLFIVLGHELIHARHNDQGDNRGLRPAPANVRGITPNAEENDVIEHHRNPHEITENDLRAEHPEMNLGQRHGHQLSPFNGLSNNGALLNGMLDPRRHP